MATVESYSFARIVVDGTQYTRDLILFPDRVEDNWWRREGHEVFSVYDEARGMEDDDII